MSEYNIPAFKIEIKWVIVAILLPLTVTAFYILFVPGSFEQNVLDIISKLDLLSAGIFFTGFGVGIESSLVAVVGYTVVCAIAWFANPKRRVKE